MSFFEQLLVARNGPFPGPNYHFTTLRFHCNMFISFWVRPVAVTTYCRILNPKIGAISDRRSNNGQVAYLLPQEFSFLTVFPHPEHRVQHEEGGRNRIIL
jgi:hypothetical protein